MYAQGGVLEVSMRRAPITWGHIITLLTGWALGDLMPTFTDPIHFWLVTNIPLWHLPYWQQSILYFYDWYILDITSPLLLLMAVWIALQIGFIQRRGSIMATPIQMRGISILVALLSFGIAVGILFNYSTTGHLWTVPQL
jgi:hypothetical protein